MQCDDTLVRLHQQLRLSEYRGLEKKSRFWHQTKNVAIIEDIIADCNENTLCQLVDCILIIGIILNQDDQIKN